MTIPMDLAGVLYAAWLALALPSIVQLAGRKTDTRALATFWGAVAALTVVFGLLFILGLLLKDDRHTA